MPSHRGDPSNGRQLAAWTLLILVYVTAAIVIGLCMVKLSG